MKKANILLVEDNPGDIRLTKEALKESKLIVNLNVVMDGVEAMRYLYKEEGFKDKKMPDLILLDLNLPKKDGRQVLKEIKQSEELKYIPVVILTTSKNDEDILNSYGLHANCYVTKPLNFDQFIKVVKNIGNFWFSIVKLPKEEE